MRVDVWDAVVEDAVVDFGYSRDLDDNFTVGDTLGKGGFGSVRVCVCRKTGEELACKSIAKSLPDTNDGAKNAKHHANMRREVAVLTALKGTLNVANIHSVYEDDSHIHIVMEYCKGGELHHSGGRLYTEELVSRYMACVLRTLVQCHKKGILHRDIKPGNFMLRDAEPQSPLKAIDFGMAVFFTEGKLPLKDLGLEGTPWFMAPEMLQSEVWPASDVWAAGVMAFQLLTGRLPFDDHANPNRPAVSKVWKSILTEKLDFTRSYWKSISEDGRDFVKLLLERDVKKRPTASQALVHSWIAREAGVDGDALPSSDPPPLHSDVVQRLQRYGQSSLFKQSILEMIAKELVPMIQSTRHGPAMFGGRAMSMASLSSLGGSHHGGASLFRGDGSAHGGVGGSGSLRGGVGVMGRVMGPPPPRTAQRITPFGSIPSSFHSLGRPAGVSVSSKAGGSTSVHGGGAFVRPWEMGSTAGLGSSLRGGVAGGEVVVGGSFSGGRRFMSSQDLAQVATASCSVCGAACGYAPTVAGLSQRGLMRYRRPAALNVHTVAEAGESMEGASEGCAKEDEQGSGSPFAGATSLPIAVESRKATGKFSQVSWGPTADLDVHKHHGGPRSPSSGPIMGPHPSQLLRVSGNQAGAGNEAAARRLSLDALNPGVPLPAKRGSLDLPVPRPPRRSAGMTSGSSSSLMNYAAAVGASVGPHRHVVLPGSRSHSVHGGAAFSPASVVPPGGGPPSASGPVVVGDTKSFYRAMRRINSMVFERQLGAVAEKGRCDFGDEPLLTLDSSLSMAHAGVNRMAVAPHGLAWDDSLVPNTSSPEGGTSQSKLPAGRTPSTEWQGRPSDLVSSKRLKTDDVSRVVCERCREASEGADGDGAPELPTTATGQKRNKPLLKRNYSDPELPALKVSDAEVLRKLMEKLDFEGSSMAMDVLADRLIEMGFQVTRNEAIHLLQHMGLGVDNNVVTRAQFMASQMDWQVLQARYKDVWIEQATRVFSELDTDGSGTVSGAEIANMLREKLQDEDVEEAVHHAFWEAGLLEDMTASCDDMEIPFDTFMGTLGRWDDLEHFEARTMCRIAENAAASAQHEQAEAMEVDEEEKAVRGGSMALAMMLGDQQSSPDNDDSMTQPTTEAKDEGEVMEQSPRKSWRRDMVM